MFKLIALGSSHGMFEDSTRLVFKSFSKSCFFIVFSLFCFLLEYNIRPKKIASTKKQRTPQKKKVFYLKKETEAFLQATSDLPREENIEPELVYICIKNNENCESLKMSEKYTKKRLRDKFKSWVIKMKIIQFL